MCIRDRARALTVEMGGKMTICDYSLSGEQVKKAAIKGTLTLAEEIGSIHVSYTHLGTRQNDPVTSGEGVPLRSGRRE